MPSRKYPWPPPPPYPAGLVATSTDRSIAVPSGYIVKTGYVDVFRVRLASRERMAVGDVDRAFQKRLQLGDLQPFPPPNGYWEEGICGKTFVINDGRHEWVATVMLGHTHILVAWLEQA